MSQPRRAELRSCERETEGESEGAAFPSVAGGAERRSSSCASVLARVLYTTPQQQQQRVQQPSPAAVQPSSPLSCLHPALRTSSIAAVLLPARPRSIASGLNRCCASRSLEPPFSALRCHCLSEVGRTVSACVAAAPPLLLAFFPSVARPLSTAAAVCAAATPSG